jgi:hypothetical protein
VGCEKSVCAVLICIYQHILSLSLSLSLTHTHTHPHVLLEEWARELAPASGGLKCVCIAAVHSHALLEDYVPQIRRHFGYLFSEVLCVVSCI